MDSEAYNQAIVLNSIYTTEIQALLDSEKQSQQQELSEESYIQGVDRYNRTQIRINSLKDSVKQIINLDNDSVPDNDEDA